MSNTRTAQRRVERTFAWLIRTARRRYYGAQGGYSALRPLAEIGGTHSPYYRPAPVGDRRKIVKAPKRIGTAAREGIFARSRGR
jgi:hypothetical protein